MADPNLDYDPVTGFNDASVFVTNPATEVITRGLFQRLFTQVQTFLNVTLVDWINATFASKADLSGIVVGQIPSGSIGNTQMANELKKGVAGGVDAYDTANLHRIDAVIHVTSGDKTSWNSKATSAQGAKADAAATQVSVNANLVEYATYHDSLSQQTNDVKFIGHRGADYVAPENTIPSFKNAGRAGFWGAECDIQPTSDGVWILMHDATVDRMTGGTGNVADLTLAQIKALAIDAGPNISIYVDLRVPTFEEYLIVCRQYDLVPMVEVKVETTSANYDSLIAMIRKYGFESKIILTSAANVALIRAKSELVYIMYVTNVIYSTSLADTLALGNAGMSIDYSIATQILIDQIHALGMKVNVWTLNDFSIAKTMIDRGVDFITSDCIVDVRWTV